jgi:hypothetical protein
VESGIWNIFSKYGTWNPEYGMAQKPGIFRNTECGIKKKCLLIIKMITKLPNCNQSYRSLNYDEETIAFQHFQAKVFYGDR